MSFDQQGRRKRVGATWVAAAALLWSGMDILPGAQGDTPSAAELFARYAAGDHEAVARALAEVEDYVAFRDDVLEHGDKWEPHAKAAFLLEAAHVELRRKPLGFYRGGYGRDVSPARAAPSTENVGFELLDLSTDTVRRVSITGVFVRRWSLASLSLLEGESEGIALRGSDLPETRLIRHAAQFGGLIDTATRHLAIALAYEKTVWHGVTWYFPAMEGRRSPATAQVRGPIVRNFNKALDRALEELTAATAFPRVRAEAEVRLGQVLAMRDWDGDRTAALDHFRRAREQDPSPDVLFLSYLFEGRVLEAKPDPASAISAYRDALAIKPQAQSARLPLAGLLFVEGKLDEASAIVEATLDEPDQLDDPWALYFYGRYAAWPERVAAMREALR